MHRVKIGGKVVLGRRILTGIFSLLVLLCLSFGYQNVFASGVQALVETQWLADNLKNPGIRVVYVAAMSPKDKENFDSKHIPGSTYLSIGSLMGALGDGSMPPDKAKFEAFMGKLGIRNDTHAVLYGTGGGNPFIPTALWLMKYFGHDKVSYLDGGFAKWSEGDLKTHSSADKSIEIKPADYKAAPDESIRADADYVLKNLKNKKVWLVDARGTDAYSGKMNEVPDKNKRTGHIPGAVNLNFYPTNLNNDGTFKSVEDLKVAYEAKGVTKDKEIIAYCQGGVRSSHTYFVLKHLLGYPKVRNYVGSWGEWSNLDPAKYPIEK
jgi:thiosulfate/3-mercaptopyruvate sulfurtransferase